MFHDSECSDPKDKVFAALGIASRRDGTIPNYEVEYTQSVEEIIDTMVEVFGLASNQDDFPTCSDIDLVFGLKGALVMVPTEEECMCCKYITGRLSALVEAERKTKSPNVPMQ